MAHKQTIFTKNGLKIVGYVLTAAAVVLLIHVVHSTTLPVSDLKILIQRFPYLLIRNQEGWTIQGGFFMNILISLASMAISTVLGMLLGIARIAPQRLIRWSAWGLVQFFRNSPWLVVIYAITYLLPYQVSLGFTLVKISPVAKAIMALSLVVSANLAEIVRGAIQSIPAGQWESAQAMGYSRWQILRLVLIPQALQRMIPPWMNWYAILTMGTTLTYIAGVQEGLVCVREISENEPQLAVPLYAILMLLFFAYCYPIARWTRKIEEKFSYLS